MGSHLHLHMSENIFLSCNNNTLRMTIMQDGGHIGEFHISYNSTENSPTTSLLSMLISIYTKQVHNSTDLYFFTGTLLKQQHNLYLLKKPQTGHEICVYARKYST